MVNKNVTGTIFGFIIIGIVVWAFREQIMDKILETIKNNWVWFSIEFIVLLIVGSLIVYFLNENGFFQQSTL